MKKINLLLVFLSFNLLFSQKEIYFPAKYVLNNSKDTIKTKVLNIDIYDNSQFSPATYITQITALDESGKKVVINENNIKYLEITDLKKTKRRFVNSKSVISKDLGLLQVMYRGRKTAWYRRNFYTGPVYTYKIKNLDYLVINKDKSITEIHFDLPGVKPLLDEKLGSYPDISSLINNMVVDQDLLPILKAYDKK